MENECHGQTFFRKKYVTIILKVRISCHDLKFRDEFFLNRVETNKVKKAENLVESFLLGVTWRSNKEENYWNVRGDLTKCLQESAHLIFEETTSVMSRRYSSKVSFLNQETDASRGIIGRRVLTRPIEYLLNISFFFLPRQMCTLEYLITVHMYG